MTKLKHIFLYGAIAVTTCGFSNEWFEFSHPLWQDIPCQAKERIDLIEFQLKEIEKILDEEFEREDIKQIKYKLKLIRLIICGFETY